MLQYVSLMYYIVSQLIVIFTDRHCAPQTPTNLFHKSHNANTFGGNSCDVWKYLSVNRGFWVNLLHMFTTTTIPSELSEYQIFKFFFWIIFSLWKKLGHFWGNWSHTKYLKPSKIYWCQIYHAIVMPI